MWETMQYKRAILNRNAEIEHVQVQIQHRYREKINNWMCQSTCFAKFCEATKYKHKKNPRMRKCEQNNYFFGKKKNKVPVTVIWNLDHQSMGTAPCVYITNLMLKDRKQNHRHPTSLSLPSHPTYIWQYLPTSNQILDNQIPVIKNYSYDINEDVFETFFKPFQNKLSTLPDITVFSFEPQLIERGKKNLQIFGQVLVLHGEIHSALDALVPGVDDLAGEARKRFLDVYIVHWIVQIVVS